MNTDVDMDRGVQRTIAWQIKVALGVLRGVAVEPLERNTGDDEAWGDLGKGDLREILIHLNCATRDLRTVIGLCGEEVRR